MSLAETALRERAESAEPRAGDSVLPTPGKYTVESTGAPQQVPLGALIEIEIVDDPQGGPQGQLTLDGEILGYTLPLTNGDFAVNYMIGKGPARLQFRQTGVDAVYLFGVSMAFPALLDDDRFKAMEDPPVTGVWGAEARPPQEPYPGT